VITQLGRDLGPGYFGENITLDRWWPQPRIGDRVHFREVSLEVSFPRVPCATLAARVGDPRFLKSFVQASRPGLYFRVLKPGAIAAGDVGQVELGPVTHPTAAALFSLWHKSPRDPGLLRSALASPIARRARPVFEAWLAQCGDAPPRSGFVQGPTNASMPQATVIPVLDYEDVLAATTWLCRAFGFTERLRIGTHRIQLDVGAGAVVLAKGPGPAAEGWSGHSVMVRVAAIDEHFALAKAAGAEVSGAPVSYPYGERQYSAKDLGGHQWTFSQSEADVDPGAWGGQLASSDTPPNAEQLP
jgi:uncharacterized glyoxalase superfamily protein PhnB